MEALRLQYEAALKEIAVANPFSPLLGRQLTFGSDGSPLIKKEVPTAVKAGMPPAPPKQLSPLPKLPPALKQLAEPPAAPPVDPAATPPVPPAPKQPAALPAAAPAAPQQPAALPAAKAEPSAEALARAAAEHAAVEEAVNLECKEQLLGFKPQVEPVS